MRTTIRSLLVPCLVVALTTLGLPASADHEGRERTRNIHPLGHIEEPRSLVNPDVGNTNIHTDIAFWGRYAFQGNWDGFTIRDISSPGNPKTISHTSCDGNQGDVAVWEDVLVRSWNAPAGEGAPPFGAGTTCDGETVPSGFEGLHVFDISDLTNPVLVGSVGLECGSHTLTAVPDEGDDRLVIFSSPSDVDCSGIDVVEVPLDDPGDASFVGFVPAAPHVHCHDTGVILGEAMLAACAGGEGFTVWEIDPDDPTSLEELYSKNVNDEPEIDDVAIGHSAGFTWDGEVLIFGHEPGGGIRPRCQETGTDLAQTVLDPPGLVQTDDMKSVFFFEARTGDFLGKWTLPRPQSAAENCTIHNYNVVPTRTGRYVLVSGNYQAGTWVADFTDPANPETVAWSDPAPKPVPSAGLGALLGLDLCGAWSSYWYNGFIYETDICDGLNLFGFSGQQTAGAIRLDHLNPQTQEFTL